MFDDRITTRLGALVTLVVIVAIALSLRGGPMVSGSTLSIRVYMNHPGKLRAHADVQLGGRVIGTVGSIRLVTTNEARKPNHLLYPLGGVVMEVVLKTRYTDWVRGNSEFFVNTKGLIGEAYLEIAPPPATEEMLPPIVDRNAVRGIDPARMEHIIVTSFMNARRFGALLTELEPSMKMLRAEISSLMQSLQELEPTLAENQLGDSIARALEEFATLKQQFEVDAPSLSQLYQQSQALANGVSIQLALLQGQAQTLSQELTRIQGKIPGDMSEKFTRVANQAKRSLATFRQTLANVQTLMAKVEAGMGTIGALLNDEEFVDDRKKLGRYIKRHPWKFLTRPLD